MINQMKKGPTSPSPAVRTENAIRTGLASLRPTMSDSTGDEVRRDRYCYDPTEPLDWAKQGRIFGQSQMRPYVVVVGGISLEDPAQMVLAQDHDVVQTLPADRTDQPFRMSILPGERGEMG
jgi:hypothetical protein